MLSWLSGILGLAGGAVAGPVISLVRSVVGSVLAVLESLFSSVTGAWDRMLSSAAALERGAWQIGREIWRTFEAILTYYIPRFAFTAWWWVTHPASLASVLGWYVLAFLEAHAWTAGRYLGELLLAMIRHNTRRVLLTLEQIIAAAL